ncbi:MAG: tRNA epoxyqueuosine(34) reductase QueG [Elusimicrobiota bacterium]|jgi:epoxyqueuosine reductase
MSSLKDQLMAYARSLGFDRMGVTSAASLENAGAYLERWISEGKAGTMRYLERNPRRRARPSDHLPGAKSVIVLAMDYYSGNDISREGKISRYAWGKDYHPIMQKRLDSLARYVCAMVPGAECRTSVDTGPLLERALAQRAGLGFIGKNTSLITRGLGSWVFLAVVLTTVDLPVDAPDTRSCGNCRRCIDACPTEAITSPHVLDARRCIAYLTIELKESLEPALRARMQGWIFGCDICQEVCPQNRRKAATQTHFSQTGGVERVTLKDLLDIRDDEAFEKRFGSTSLKRARRHGLLRNACVAAVHLRRSDLIPQLQNLTKDPHPVIRETAAWALKKAGPADESGAQGWRAKRVRSGAIGSPERSPREGLDPSSG